MTDENEEPEIDDESDESAPAEPKSNEPDEPDADADAGPASRSRLPLLTAALGIAVVVLAALFAVTLLDRADLEKETDRADDVAAVASAFGEALYSYDYRDIDAQLRTVEELTTATYAVEYREDFEANLRSAIVESEVVSTAEVHEVLVNRSTGDQAQAIVITTTTVEGPNDTAGTISTLVQLSLLRVDGEWRVDKVLTIANQGGVTDPEGNPISTDPSVSSTTVPPITDETVDDGN